LRNQVIEPVPPFTALALNCTLVPAQILPLGVALMLIETGKAGFTLRVTVLDVAGLPVAQAKEEVNTA
jgi:hypothetical protein